MKKRITAGILSVFLVVSALTGCGSLASSSESQGSANSPSEASGSAAESGSEEAGKSGGLTPVRLGVMTSNIDHEIALIAEDQGFYKENGLDVTITEYAAGINTVDAITTDQLDIGFVADYAGVNRIGNTSKDTDLRFFANFASSAQTDLYVNPKTISVLSDLKGKNFITQPGTVWDYWTGLTIQKAGLTSDDVNLVQVSSAAEGLAVAQSGGGDAYWASGANAQKLEEAGWKAILSQEELNAVTYQFYLATESYLEKNEETVESFLKATQETIDYIEDNSDEAAAFLNQKVGIEKSIFLAYLKAYDLGIGFSQDALDDLNSINDWAYQNGNYSTEYNIEDFVNTEAVKKAFPDTTEVG